MSAVKNWWDLLTYSAPGLEFERITAPTPITDVRDRQVFEIKDQSIWVEQRYEFTEGQDWKTLFAVAYPKDLLKSPLGGDQVAALLTVLREEASKGGQEFSPALFAYVGLIPTAFSSDHSIRAREGEGILELCWKWIDAAKPNGRALQRDSLRELARHTAVCKAKRPDGLIVNITPVHAADTSFASIPAQIQHGDHQLSEGELRQHGRIFPAEEHYLAATFELKVVPDPTWHGQRGAGSIADTLRVPSRMVILASLSPERYRQYFGEHWKRSHSRALAPTLETSALNDPTSRSQSIAKSLHFPRQRKESERYQRVLRQMKE